MEPKTRKRLDREILQLVRSRLGESVISRFLAHQRKAYNIERSLTSRTTRTRNRPGRLPAISPSENHIFDHLVTLCQQILPEDRFLEVLLELGSIQTKYGELQSAERIYGIVVANGDRSCRPTDTATALLLRGEVHSRLGRWIESHADLQESREIFLRLGDHRSLALINNIVGTNYAEQGFVDNARQCFLRALDQFESDRDRRMTGLVLMNLGIIENILSNFDEALDHYRRALSLFKEAIDPVLLAEIHHSVGMTYLSKGNYTTAMREFNSSWEHAKPFGNPELLGMAILGKATAYLRLKRYRAALTCCDDALNLFIQGGMRLSLAVGYKVKGMIFRELGRYDEATLLFHSSIRLNEEYTNILNLGETWFELGLLEQARQDTAAAALAFRRASDYFKLVGARGAIERTHRELVLLDKAQHELIELLDRLNCNRIKSERALPRIAAN